jgi:hypothetical protein
MCRLKSGASSVHQTGPRSPRPTFASLTASRAAALSASGLLPCSARLASINCLTNFARVSVARPGFDVRQRRPRTTKYRPSGVTGCWSERSVAIQSDSRGAQFKAMYSASLCPDRIVDVPVLRKLVEVLHLLAEHAQHMSPHKAYRLVR